MCYIILWLILYVILCLSVNTAKTNPQKSSFLKSNQECHIKWMPIFTACEYKFKILIFQQVGENPDGLLDHYLNLLQNLFQLAFQAWKDTQSSSNKLQDLEKNHHFNGHIFILFLSVINRMITASPLFVVTLFPISAGPHRRHLIKSFLISSCFSLSLISFPQNSIV